MMKQIEIGKSPVEFFDSVSDRDYAFFLDSGMSHDRLGRYSFIGYEPFMVFRSKGRAVEVIRDGKTEDIEANPFDVLEGLLKDYRVDETELPFTGGAVGFFGYDLKDMLYDLPQLAEDDIRMWDCVLGFYDSVLVFDHLEKKWYLTGCGFTDRDYGGEIERASEFPGDKEENSGGFAGYKSNFKKEEYLRTLKRVKEYIAAGDIYQANISQRLEAEMMIESWELYKRLREINPAPFAAFLNFGDIAVVSASPERFFRVEGRRIETRPIKGTRPRGGDSEEDKGLEKELLASEKDKAEHVMIVDLERNDLGKVCEFGSIKVSEFEVIEGYSTVFQMVSTVEGVLREDVSQVDCLRAMFPGGSITGAPKVRAMEIIEELEPTKRGLYTGSIGYLGFNGNIDLSIVIRTFLVKDNRAYFQVGGGIVADSSPEAEYQETMDKAKALIDSLQGE
ncbi:MAG: aminodeoxychorismate synthase component I [Candidatus Altiarchaeota archaeon]|nr:aminodeoxychorismate synthase component I [Candidatus Altiarchaeota archaeon]